VTQASVEAARYAGERPGRNGTVPEIAGMLDDELMRRSAGGKVGFVPWDRLRDDKGRVQFAYGDALTTYRRIQVRALSTFTPCPGIAAW
jgi:hypothetical protein